MEIAIKNGMVVFTDGDFRFSVNFHRTVRLPEDGRTHALPPSLGSFPVRLVDDFKDKVPADWVEHGGVFLPMHQREALWLQFHGHKAAVKVAAGKINAVSGQPWDPELAPEKKSRKKNVDPTQDYMIAPSPQCWLDGFNSGNGVIKQFVGMALGQGYTVEGQVTGEEKFGGIQILVVPPKESAKKKINPPVTRGGLCMGGGPFDGDVPKGPQGSAGSSGPTGSLGGSVFCSSASPVIGSSSLMRSASMSVRKRATQKGAQIGLAAGGSMKQKIYPDPYGIKVWDQKKAGRLYIHIINAELYQEITGVYPPEMPVSPQDYDGPWFDLNDGHKGDVAASETLTSVKTVAEKDEEHGFEGQQDDSEIDESGKVHTYDMDDSPAKVRNGTW
jgi:hypothetical protein